MIINYCRWILTAAISVIISLEKHAEAEQNWPEVKKLEDGLYDFDGVIIDQKNRKVKFPMICNQESGLIEYAIVHENGKIHESLFRTTIRPQILHASLLLSKAKAFENYFTNQNDSNFTVRDLSKHILEIEVTWDANGSSFSRNIRDFYFNQNDINNKPEAKIFLFTGSRMIEKTFMAEHTGSIIGVYMDPDAIINSIESNSDNDELWLAKKSTMPPLESMVTCHLLLPE